MMTAHSTILIAFHISKKGRMRCTSVLTCMRACMVLGGQAVGLLGRQVGGQAVGLLGRQVGGQAGSLGGWEGGLGADNTAAVLQEVHDGGCLLRETKVAVFIWCKIEPLREAVIV